MLLNGLNRFEMQRYFLFFEDHPLPSSLLDTINTTYLQSQGPNENDKIIFLETFPSTNYHEGNKYHIKIVNLQYK